MTKQEKRMELMLQVKELDKEKIGIEDTLCLLEYEKNDLQDRIKSQIYCIKNCNKKIEDLIKQLEEKQ